MSRYIKEGLIAT